MDTQLKKGLLEVCILAVLSKEDSYGYKIIKDLSPYIDMSESTLYPILRRLEMNQCLSIYSVEHNSRLRKYYKITETGIEKIKEFIEEWTQINAIYEFVKGAKENEKNDI